MNNSISIKLNSSLKKNKSNINSLIKNSNQSSNSPSNSNQFISYNVNINPEPLGEGSFKKCFHLLDKNNKISEKYILCIYIPKTKNHINRKEEIIQEELSKKCRKYVTKLYDYGSIDDSLEIKKIFNKINSSNDFYYIIYEKGSYELFNILYDIKKFFNINKTKLINVNKYLIMKKNLLIFYINILIQLIFGIKCIHEKGYLHLDIKPENILVFQVNHNISDNNIPDHYIKVDRSIKRILNIKTDYIIVKYSDFGFSGFKSNDKKNISGTSKYINSKVLQGKKKFDIYSDLYAISKMFEQLIISKDLLNQFSNEKVITLNYNKEINKLFLNLIKDKNKLKEFKKISNKLIINQRKPTIKAKLVENENSTNQKDKKIYKFFGNYTYNIPVLVESYDDPYELLINILEHLKELIINDE